MSDPGPRAPRLVPYSGPDLLRRKWLGESHVASCYGDDLDGVRTYRFNALGFRGEDYDPEARHQVFVFGESHAFGYFLDLEASWSYRFVERWARSEGLDPADVSVLNFADIGASNAYIARMVLTQCARVEPDLVLVQFGGARRAEALIGGRPTRLGPWHLDPSSRREVEEAAPERADRIREEIARAKAFFRYAAGRIDLGDITPETDAGLVLDTVLNILQVQHFCRARGLRALATCDDLDRVYDAGFLDHDEAGPILRPLVEQFDPAFLSAVQFGNFDGRSSDDPSHGDAAWHEAFAAALIDPFGNPPAKAQVSRRVRSFYEEQPFNHWQSAAAAAESLRENVVETAYPDLHGVLESRRDAGLRVLELGCGGGWLANTLALHYGADVLAVDFCSRVVQRARDVAAELDVVDQVDVREADLTTLQLDETFDAVVSLGVLHHLPDARRGVARACTYVSEDGVLYLGLYHLHSRRPFLDHFRELVAEKGEDAAFEEFRRLTADRYGDGDGDGDGGDDDEHRRSWFRDQVLHPWETSHTLAEVAGWLAEEGFAVVSTSLNGFRRNRRLERVLEAESREEGRAALALRKGRFVPGFFTVLASPLAGPVEGSVEGVVEDGDRRRSDMLKA